MGDMADYLNEQDEDAFYDYLSYDRTVTCHFCKRDGFHWEHTGDGWRLHTHTGQVHKCKNHPLNNRSSF